MAIEIQSSERFESRHLGPREDEIGKMLATLGYASMGDLIADVVPASILRDEPLGLPEALSEVDVVKRAREIAAKNRVLRSYIGMGYHATVTPPVIQRNILENPGWYTQYTPYQAEISQGRLEALLNFQTMVIDLTGLEIANASLLDEGTAAAEAMSMLAGEVKRGEDRSRFFVSDACHPQTIAVVKTRARPLGIDVEVGDWETFEFESDLFGALVQYPTTDGLVVDYRDFCDRAHAAGAGVVVAADLMALTLLTPPGEFGADVAVGNTQRFGVPMGYGGPHAAYLAAHDGFKRKMPGRIIGVSVDTDGNPALRMALQTREQHIRREKATSNICTAQVLLAVMAGMYGVYHGPEGIRNIAQRIHNLTAILARGLERLGHEVIHRYFFDTLRVRPHGASAPSMVAQALEAGINLRDFGDGTLGIALDETVTAEDIDDLFSVFSEGDRTLSAQALANEMGPVEFPRELVRTSAYMEHPVFHSHRSETELLRYTKKLESRDLSLTTSMIPLGSCTMKLNATTEMIPVTWPEFASLHPFVPQDQALGYEELAGELGSWLLEITGFSGVSLQPNSGAQGEYAGLLTIRGYHEARGEGHRNVCLIPASAHGTNPASAVMAGMKVVVVKTDDRGNIELGDLKAKAEAHSDALAAIMVTYPSTHGVFEEEIREICALVHEHGGQVYMDGANLNAQVGLSRPGEFGADVLHINLHKTFAIPHGGGGPGMGPICCGEHLTPHLPDHPMRRSGQKESPDTVSAAPWGSASILLISWAYIAMLGARGVRRASEVAILNANYMAHRLNPYFPVLYTGAKGRVGHEFILDLHDARRDSGVTDEDVAKRLMDYGFHAPTQSFPVIGTLMVEPTESEPLSELDRLCDALISIRGEIQAIIDGKADREDNLLKNAPHTARLITGNEWSHPYDREQAAYPVPGLIAHKFWPYVRRVNNAHGDRNLICACPPIVAYARGGSGWWMGRGGSAGSPTPLFFPVFEPNDWRTMKQERPSVHVGRTSMATLTYHGHSTFSMTLDDGTRMVLDPWFDDSPVADIKTSDIDKLDYIFCTHGHWDHFADAIPLAKKTGATLVSTFEIVSFAQGEGVENAHPMHIGGGYTFPFGYVKMTAALHGGQVAGDTTGQFTTVPGGFLFNLDGTRVYAAGDTALLTDMQLLKGQVDVALLPIGDNFTMGPEDAVRAIEFIEPKVVIPIHYNTFPPIVQDPGDFAWKVGDRAEVWILEAGDSVNL